MYLGMHLIKYSYTILIVTTIFCTKMLERMLRCVTIDDYGQKIDAFHLGKVDGNKVNLQRR